MKHDKENPNCPLNNVTADDISVDCKCEKLMGDKEKASSELVNLIANNCCKVCACENGKKVWCACHRKQIDEALHLAREEGKDKGRQEERKRCIRVFKKRYNAYEGFDKCKISLQDWIIDAIKKSGEV